MNAKASKALRKVARAKGKTPAQYRAAKRAWPRTSQRLRAALRAGVEKVKP